MVKVNGATYSELEMKIKELAKEKYGSILQFTNTIDMPYATFDSMLRRGVNNSTVENVIKVCNGLHISADELSKGRIVPATKIDTNNEGPTDILAILSVAKNRLLACEGLTFNGDPADPESVQSILDAMEIGINIALKRKEAKKIENKDDSN